MSILFQRFFKFFLVPVLMAASAGMATTALAAPAIKPGLWEMKMKNMQGGAGMPDAKKMNAAMQKMQEHLAKMPPEQRRMMEEQMASLGVGMSAGGGGMGFRVCMTADQIKNEEIPLQQENCTTKIKTRTASRWVASTSCTKPVMSGEVEAIFNSANNYVVNVKGTVTEGGTSQPYSMAMEWNFISAACGAIKPITAPKNAEEAQKKQLEIQRQLMERMPRGKY